jgi:hypothetical protein
MEPDVGLEIRGYLLRGYGLRSYLGTRIPDFSDGKNHDSYMQGLEKLLGGLKAENPLESSGGPYRLGHPSEFRASGDPQCQASLLSPMVSRLSAGHVQLASRKVNCTDQLIHPPRLLW